MLGATVGQCCRAGPAHKELLGQWAVTGRPSRVTSPGLTLMPPAVAGPKVPVLLSVPPGLSVACSPNSLSQLLGNAILPEAAGEPSWIHL